MVVIYEVVAICVLVIVFVSATTTSGRTKIKI